MQESRHEANRVAIVTAAGSGMGAAIARELAERGWRLVINSSSDKSGALAAELGARHVAGSVAESSTFDALVSAAMDAYGRLDAVVNSAPHPPKGELLALTDADWHRGLDLVYLNVVRCARAVTPVFERQQQGVIVNISTFAAFEPDLMFPVSGPLRAALGAFTKLYADRYASAGIRMNNLLPGYIDSLPEKAERRARIPMGRYGTAQEIARTVAFLVSEDAAYITGQNIRVDGGITRAV